MIPPRLEFGIPALRAEEFVILVWRLPDKKLLLLGSILLAPAPSSDLLCVQGLIFYWPDCGFPYPHLRAPLWDPPFVPKECAPSRQRARPGEWEADRRKRRLGHADMITRIALRDFRCFESLETDLDPELNCFVGKNALGKTSLLEAVAVLTRLQSPRASSLQNVVRFGARGFYLDGLVDRCRMQFYYGARRRKLALDSVEQPDTEQYLSLSQVVFFGNADLDLVRGTNEIRRKFLDFLGAQIFAEYRRTNRAYDKALRSRNFCLKTERFRELDAYTQVLLRYGSELSDLRQKLVDRSRPHVSRAFAEISEGSDLLEVSYVRGATEDFASALAASAAEEHRLRATLVGPHRDDLVLCIDGHPAASFGSEGQQRTIAIALRMGEVNLLSTEKGASPILLLDDIFGELDLARRNRLLRALPRDAQRFVTSTTLNWVDELEMKTIFEIEPNNSGGRMIARIKARN